MPAPSVDDVYQESSAAIYTIYPFKKGLFASIENLVYRDRSKIYLQFLADQLPPDVVDKLLLSAFKEGVRETLQL